MFSLLCFYSSLCCCSPSLIKMRNSRLDPSFQICSAFLRVKKNTVASYTISTIQAAANPEKTWQDTGRQWVQALKLRLLTSPPRLKRAVHPFRKG